ncbi:MAG: hypothetical protein A2992_07585 [Elusimicrobia bacterium RIFCSPLOWO2_01_FULL_59_12]|nr:MAG: hypothetical protein A2992_07585 [Elusimicrobia bacterium RIFCSPLOWO2_01_FULL_59_12]
MPAERKKIGAYFQNKPEVQGVFLFGSQARKRARPTSDIDLAVYLDASVPETSYLEKRLQYLADLSRLIDPEPDVIILNEAPPVLTHQVLRYGKLLHEKNHHATTAFKARAMIDYVDWLPYKARLDASTLKHFRAPHGR